MPKLSLLALRRDSNDLAFSAGEAEKHGDVVDDYRIIARRWSSPKPQRARQCVPHLPVAGGSCSHRC